MSLIHEALEKLDLEKKAGWRKEKPAEITPKEERRDPNARMIYGMGGVLLLCFIVGLIYFLTSPPESGNERKESSPAPASTFKASGKSGPFFLTGITQAGSEWNAIINNKLVRVGDEVSGAKVESIGQGGVILNFKGQTITLSLHGDSLVHLTQLEMSR